jgi:Carboxypeptidase regulatory-like domain
MSETRSRVLPGVVLPIAIITLFALTLCAQDSATGSIRGVVLDPGGARLPQASVAIANSATDARYFATSDTEGRFAFEMLPPGDYSARVEAHGMSPEVTPSAHVDVGGVSELHFRLSLAGAERGLDTTRRKIGERFPVEWPPVFRFGAFLARRHARSARADVIQ